MILLTLLLVALLVFFAILLIRTLGFVPPKRERRESEPCDFDRTAAIDALAALVRCRTVSRPDPKDEDEAEFEKLLSLLPTLYPHIIAATTEQRFPGRGMLYRWQGRSPGHATVLMAHYDVVCADGEGWRHPPFDAVLEDGKLWGRGTVDTKVTVNAILFAADTLAKEGYVPEHDVYFAFSGSEEVAGPGASAIVSHFAAEGIEVDLVLDEGGAVVDSVFPGTSVSCAMVGIAEKGMLDLEYRVRTAGGHASTPPAMGPVDRLARAVRRVKAHPPRMRITPPAAKMLNTLARHSTFGYRLVFANLFFFAPLLGLFGRRYGGEMNALVRTTVAFTRMTGSEASNVLPTEAVVVSDSRLIPGDTVDGTVAHIRRAVGDDGIEIRPILSTDPGRTSRTDGPGWERLSLAIEETWQDTVVTPYLMLQCTDSRHWCTLSDSVFRFSPIDLTEKERLSIHAKNEHIRTGSALRAVEFYIRLLKNT